jgi:hypothetical protein
MVWYQGAARPLTQMQKRTEVIREDQQHVWLAVNTPQYVASDNHKSSEPHFFWSSACRGHGWGTMRTQYV